MPVFDPSQNTSAYIAGSVQRILQAMRDSLYAVEALYRWSSTLAASDLEAVGFSATDAATILSAIADANALATINFTGQPPASYPQASSVYVYAASQSQVIGPQ